MDDVLTDTAAWALIVGFLSPLVIAAVQQPTWSNRIRALVTFLYSVIVGVITAWLNGTLDGRAVVSAVLLIFVMAISTYRGLWKETGVTGVIEAATSPGRHAA